MRIDTYPSNFPELTEKMYLQLLAAFAEQTATIEMFRASMHGADTRALNAERAREQDRNQIERLRLLVKRGRYLLCELNEVAGDYSGDWEVLADSVEKFKKQTAEFNVRPGSRSQSTSKGKKKAEKLHDALVEISQLRAQLDGLGKCSDGRMHVLYAIESGNWIEEVGCERCLLKIAGQKGDADFAK
jgi:hypothetical protein